MNDCLCCSGQLVRQPKRNSIYWFCSRCREEMPILSAVSAEHKPKIASINSCNNSLS